MARALRTLHPTPTAVPAAAHHPQRCRCRRCRRRLQLEALMNSLDQQDLDPEIIGTAHTRKRRSAADMEIPLIGYYYKSEKHAASAALKILESKLPDTPSSAARTPEWGTTIFRWEDPAGGYKYSFQEPYQAVDPDGLWRPVGRIPWFAKARAHAHNHPNNTYFSNIDLQTARGERGLPAERTVMYMVNKTGAYWYDGRTEYLSENARHGLMWGKFPDTK